VVNGAGDGLTRQTRERQICSVCTAIQRITNWLSSMAENHSTKGRSQRHGGTPLVVASAVAAFGVLAMLIVDHGPLNKPKLQPAVMATYSTTGEAAARSARPSRQPSLSRRSNRCRPAPTPSIQ
jgi:hypothetical protein